MFDLNTDGVSPIVDSGVDFSNATQAASFLATLLDDTHLQQIGVNYASFLWIGIALATLFAVVLHWLGYFIRNLRKRRARKGQCPSIPGAWGVFTMPASFLRPVTYWQLYSPAALPWLKIPALGPVLLIIVYTSFIVGLEFIGNNISGGQFWQQRGVRAGWLAVAQLPLIVLLVGKRNWITLLTGVSSERLNVFHRWAARVMLLLATFHFGFQAKAWSKYPGIFTLEWTTDLCVPTGLAAFILLCWINVSTLAPFRRLSYEIFVLQHILTFFGFIIAIMYHLPTTAIESRTVVYIPIGLWLLDRVIRAVLYAYVNISSKKATLTKLSGNVTQIRTRCAKVSSWRPGAYVLISFPKIGFGQSHPVTIASSPQSHGGDLVLLLKSRRGFTSSLLAHATEQNQVLGGNEDRYRILVDGTYGGLHADFACFNSICLVAGGIGITFISAVIYGIAEAVAGGILPLRRMHVIWIFRNTAHLGWTANDLSTALNAIKQAGIEVTVSLFVTADDYPTDLGWSQELGVWTAQGDMLSQIEMRSNTTTCNDNSTFEKNTSPSRGIDGYTSPRVSFGRPDLKKIIHDTVTSAEAECGIAACGPDGMNTSVRNAVASLSGRSRGRDVYLHVEGFHS